MSEEPGSEEAEPDYAQLPREELEDRLRASEEAVAELQEELSEREEEAEELKERLKRKQADLQNYKKRAKDRMEERERRGEESVLGDVLDVRDALQRALDTEGKEEDLEEGLRLTLEKLDSALESHGVERVGVEEFDHERHEALARIPAPDVEGGDIVEVHREGFEREGEILRPARVTVAEEGGGEEE